MGKYVCPKCGGELCVRIIPHYVTNDVFVSCPTCHMQNYIAFYFDEFSPEEEIVIALDAFVENVKDTIGKKWIEIEDNTPMGNYYGSGGMWVEADDATNQSV